MDDAKSSPIVSDAKSNSVDMIARLEAHRDRGPWWRRNGIQVQVECSDIVLTVTRAMVHVP